MDIKLFRQLLEADIFTPVSDEEAAERTKSLDVARGVILNKFKEMYAGLPEAIQAMIPNLKGGEVKWSFWIEPATTTDDEPAVELTLSNPKNTLMVLLPLYKRDERRSNLWIDVFVRGIGEQRSTQLGQWNIIKKDWNNTPSSQTFRELSRINSLIKKYKED